MANSVQLPMPYQVRADLFLHLATLERSGLPPDKAWALLKLPAQFQPRVEATRRHLARGRDIATAGTYGSLWTPFESALLQAAQTAGDMTPAYQRLAEYYSQRAMQWAQIKKRMSYPAFLCLSALFIQPLPQLMSGAISPRYYLLRIIALLCAIALTIGAGMLAHQRWQISEPSASRLWLDQGLLCVPIFGGLHRRRNLCDFWYSLALLQAAGVAMFEAVPLALKTVPNGVIRRALEELLPALKKGATLAQAVAKNSFLQDQTLLGYVQSGEAAGRLEEMLTRYAQGEDARLALALEQVAQWLPRIAYAIVAGSIAYNIVAGGGGGMSVPADL